MGLPTGPGRCVASAGLRVRASFPIEGYLPFLCVHACVCVCVDVCLFEVVWCICVCACLWVKHLLYYCSIILHPPQGPLFWCLLVVIDLDLETPMPHKLEPGVL